MGTTWSNHYSHLKYKVPVTITVKLPVPSKGQPAVYAHCSPLSVLSSKHLSQTPRTLSDALNFPNESSVGGRWYLRVSDILTALA